jgi:hypothetical protein
MVQAGWDHVPHLDEKTKRELIESYPPHERKARTEGTPSLGAGAIYPIDRDEYEVQPFPIPGYWPRCYGLDVGWKKTAAVWLAKDRDTGTVYAYTEHYRGQAEPPIHAAAIKARGEWIPGAIDPAADGRSQVDGAQLLRMYEDQGLKLTKADNSVEAGIYTVWEMLSTGQLKVFSSCRNLLGEMSIYRRDENGKVVKKNDHACDALRYAVMGGIEIATTQPVASRQFGDMSRGDDRSGY